MSRRILWSGSTVLPAPSAISVNDEIIWSANAGRSANGAMIGDVVAQKKNVAITWGILTEAEMAVIKSVCKAGFFTISFHDDGVDLSIRAYRGTLTKEAIGYLSDGVYYYRSASLSIIQK